MVLATRSRSLRPTGADLACRTNFRIDVDRGRAGRVTRLHGATLTLPDALRPLGQGSFLLVEGAGTLDRVDVEGDGFKAVPIRDAFRAPTSVTRGGSTAWVSEDQLPV